MQLGVWPVYSVCHAPHSHHSCNCVQTLRNEGPTISCPVPMLIMFRETIVRGSVLDSVLCTVHSRLVSSQFAATTLDWIRLLDILFLMRANTICGETRTCSFSSELDASRRGKNKPNSSRDKNEGTYRSGEGRGGPAIWPRIWATTGRGRESNLMRE